ncbi:MAG: Acetyltransferase [Acidobacteria bacterium]|jgi:ribosomal-protein-alanine acetyltransferase|nr:Acetyltransferase [Acidobacteriota bacterium]
MAVLQTILNLFAHEQEKEPEIIVPAPPCVYEIRTLTDKQQKEVMDLNLRCFKNGENYTRHTFAYLLGDPKTLSYRVITPDGEMVGFIFVMLSENGTGHLTTIGVSPEHRRRGLAEKLLTHTEEALRKRDVNTIMLEVRVSNSGAQELYKGFGYSTVQRVPNYYNNGEDCFLMVKSLY